MYREKDHNFKDKNASNQFLYQDYNDYGPRAGYRNQSTGRINPRNLTQYNQVK